jgi:hypothetical protein
VSHGTSSNISLGFLLLFQKLKARRKAKKDAAVKNPNSKRGKLPNEGEPSTGRKMLEEKDKCTPTDNGGKPSTHSGKPAHAAQFA